jgi:UDPglucose--hexose-1-phosphate uridylyltransferase
VPEIRTDWLTGRTVILAENRALRPNDFAAESVAAPSSTAPCPFCPGQESLTPAAVYTQNDAAGRWQIRVVPNKFPALDTDVAPPEAAPAPFGAAMAATGVHEVVIESARHVDRMSQLMVAELAAVLATYRARLRHWRESGRFEYALVFKNLGAKAGASLAHVHSQLVALPQLPPLPAAEFERAERSCSDCNGCAYCTLVDTERTTGERIVFEREGFIAFCPYASLQPYETWLMPVTHQPWFELSGGSGQGDDTLAGVLHDLLVRIERILPLPAYNLLIRTGPWRPTAASAAHWRVEILPRVNSFAGLELATGIHINPLSPSRAAAELRAS